MYLCRIRIHVAINRCVPNITYFVDRITVVSIKTMLLLTQRCRIHESQNIFVKLIFFHIFTTIYPSIYFLFRVTSKQIVVRMTFQITINHVYTNNTQCCDLFFIFKNVVAYLIRFCIHINIVLHSIIHRVNFFNWKLKKLTFLINFVWEISEFNALNSITKWKKSHHPKKRKTYKKKWKKQLQKSQISCFFNFFLWVSE